MSELNRQLREYLSQSRAGPAGDGADSRPLLIPDSEPSPPAPGWASRLNPFSSPLSGRSAHPQNASPPPPGGWATDPDPCLPSLSRRQRLVGFGLCLAAGLACFGLSALYAPFLLLRARKFALLFTMGSLFLLGSLALLRGPWNQLRLLASLDHLPFTAAYLGSLLGTLYAALALRSTPLTAVAASIQLAALAAYILSSVPGGTTGLRFLTGLLTSLCKRTVSKSLPL
ncbi:vesicle transport protein SFT2C [Leucoraja erinacea]|uniref:vesicle transport protein SFT2C n=1 Tax=Leucoraja erinaceus TaxID=7782 RepID=UPI002454FA17|nr:vesicle transport protein SFT2C [Leucoraja erinacea]